MDVPRGGRGRPAPRGRRRLAVRQSMVRIAAAATPPTPTSSTNPKADHGRKQHVEITAVIHTEVALDSVADLVSSG